MFEVLASERSSRRPVRRFLVMVGALLMSLLFLAACTSDSLASSDANSPDAVEEPASSSTTTTTTEVPNRAPEIRVAAMGRAEIGQRLAEPILAFDPDGDDVVVTISDGPLGFSPTLNARGRVTGLEWEPVEPGEWTVLVTGTDPEGAMTSTEVLLVARNTRSIDLLLAMGCLLYTSPSPRDATLSRMPSSA